MGTPATVHPELICPACRAAIWGIMPGGVEATGGARAGGTVGSPETVLSALVTADDGKSWHVFLYTPGSPLDLWWGCTLQV